MIFRRDILLDSEESHVLLGQEILLDNEESHVILGKKSYWTMEKVT